MASSNPNAPKWIFEGSRSYASRLQSTGEGLRRRVEYERDDRVLERDPEEWLEELLELVPEVPRLAGREDWRLLEHGSRNGVSLVVAFEGDPAFFDDRVGADRHSPVRPRLAMVKDQELTIPLVNVGRNFEGKNAAEQAVGRIESELGLASAHLATARARISEQLAQAIERRRGQVERHRAEVEGLGIPIRPRDGAPKVFKDPGIVRRPTPVGAAPAQKEGGDGYRLSEDFFEHINGVIRAAGRAMSASPGTYAGWDEEDRRQVLLLMLNTHYEGAVFAEAFNASGKTDLLVRHEGRNLYVAECKVWSGAKAFSDSIDQLFRYSTWEDVKLALIVFVRSRGLTEVIAKSRMALAAHPGFRAFVKLAEETELRATMSWPGDEHRQVTLQVTFVHVPD